MHQRNVLSPDQIDQLKIQLNKILQHNLTSFAEKYNQNRPPSIPYHFDSLFQFSTRQHQRLIKSLEQVVQFTFAVMNNFQLLWQENTFKDTKLLELRQTFASATAYIQELNCENYELKNKLNEAEMYIEWIQQQKQCLDAMYEDGNSSTTATSAKNARLSRCVSERSIRWNESRVRKNTFTFQRLKDYVDRLREERNELQTQLISLSKKYKIKCQQCRKAHLFIEHLINRLKTKDELKQYIEIVNSNKNDERAELITQDILQILERHQFPCSSTSLRSHLECFDFDTKDESCQYSAFNFPDTSFKQLNRSDHAYSVLNPNPNKETKDVEISTESQLLDYQTAETQTENKENKPKQKKIDYKISIHITGQENQQIQIDKVIKNLQLQKKLENKLRTQIIETDEQKADGKLQIKNTNKNSNSRFGEILEYYHQRCVSKRIKKYAFEKPDTKPIYKFYKK